ncbi:MAG: hypothetical protein MHMPM18_004563 [Marteilia pararefringens]
MDLAANRIASLFTDLQNQSTKDEADRLLQEFLKDQTNAIEILLHILDDSANVRFNPLQKYSSAIQLKNVLKKYYSVILISLLVHFSSIPHNYYI